MVLNTISEAVQRFDESPEIRNNPRLGDNLKSVLRRYILPSYDFTPEELRHQLDQCLAKVSLRDLKDFEAKFEAQLQLLQSQGTLPSAGTVRNYRSALNRFRGWVEEQPWFVPVLPVGPQSDRAPVMSVGRSKAVLTEQKRAAKQTFGYLAAFPLQPQVLTLESLPETVQQQFLGLEAFWTKPDVPARKGDPIEAAKFAICQNVLLVFVDWLSIEKALPAAELNLQSMGVMEDLQAFIEWGLLQKQGYGWASEVAEVALLVVKWANPQSKQYHFADVPVIWPLKRYIQQLKSQREDIGFYRLQPSEVSERLRVQLDRYRSFCLDLEVPERKGKAIAEKTLKVYFEGIHAFLGWLHRYSPWLTSLSELELADITNLDLLQPFISWGINVRKNRYGWAKNVGQTALSVAKFLNPQARRKDFSDVEQVELVREYARYLQEQDRNQEGKDEPEGRLLTFQEAQVIVEYLKKCCAPLDKYGDERSFRAQLQAWQRYLIIALLTYCPVRQKEIREMEQGKTLFREADRYWVKLKPSQHKAGRRTGKGREYPLPQHLTADLDTWWEKWRSTIPTSHRLVFIQTGANRCPETQGRPLNETGVTDLVGDSITSATGILFGESFEVTPHSFRDIGVTYQRRYGRPEQQEAFAELMGHTPQEANRTYNRQTSRERTQKADGWWQLQLPLSAPESNHLPKVIPQSWSDEDDYELSHLDPSVTENLQLKQLRDQVVLALWALEEFTWAQLHRANVGDLVEHDNCYRLEVNSREGQREVLLKPQMTQIIRRYFDKRTALGEELMPLSPFLIAIGNRAGGKRLWPRGIQVVVEAYLGKVSSRG
uniref:Tyr recombinase domain-containing protein n=1 Tax=Cyanothece sp. (strain PCC 7425 / ATCC 29141) TaxID=395961 RepID=B8HZQ7_CYAP4